jgi:uncharacterized protein YdhG (YjbR/CyaY superfamily)
LGRDANGSEEFEKRTVFGTIAETSGNGEMQIMANQSENQYSPVVEYIDAFPEPVRSLLFQMREAIQKSAPEAVEAICYHMPTYKLNGNLVHFAGYKNHIGFYPTPSAIEKFKHALMLYKTSKGAIQFPIDQPLPLELVREIVLFRVKESSATK